MLFKNKFDKEFQDLNRNIEVVAQAVVALRDNEDFKEFIGLLLQVGNYLNFGTPKGKAMGFQMELLQSISTIKSVGKKKISLLEFLVRNILRNNPKVLKFTKELMVCDTASKIELPVLTTKVGEFEKGLEKVKKEVQRAEEQLLVLSEELERFQYEEKSDP